ncbi:efflux RND transporter permease subunit, partial [bacterium]|nr:efflux RND transporter permease subunit [bacterium]
MNLTKLILSGRHTIWALVIAATIFGLIAYRSMPMQLFPDTAPPLVNVITGYPGAAAEDVARDVSDLLEKEFASVPGVHKIKSTSQDNISIVMVEFQYDEDVDMAALDIQNAVSRIRYKLPQTIREPQVLKFSTNDKPIVTIGVLSKNLIDARSFSEEILAPQLQRIEGVAAVDLFGGAKKSILIDIDREKLETYRIPLQKVVEEIRKTNIDLPAGTVRRELTTTTFRIEARSDNLDRLRKIPVVTAANSRILISDIARVYEGSLEDDSRFSIDGTRTIALQVYKSEDANTVEIVEKVLSLTESFKEKYPNMTFIIGEESASFTKTTIDNLLNNIWQALFFAAMIIFLFIGRIKMSLIAAVSMPLSYGITFAMMKLMDVEFNMVTLSAIILAVGMVVDASVVVLENISRKRESGTPDLEESAEKGANEVFQAVLAGGATTLIVLIPLLFLGGFIGKTFGPLAITLIIALLSSLFVALFLIPVLSLYTGNSKFDAWGELIAKPFTLLMDYIKRGYIILLSVALRFRFITLMITLMLFIGGLLLIKNQGMEVLPRMDGGSFFISLQTPSGTSLEETARIVKAVEAVVQEEPEVIKVQSQVGFEEGMLSFASSGAQGATQGNVTVTLTPRTEREDSVWDIEERVRTKVAKIPGIYAMTVRELGNTATSTTIAPIVVRISGEDPLIIDAIGHKVLAKMNGMKDLVEPTRTWSIDNERKIVKVNMLRTKEMGLNPAAIAYQMQMGSVGIGAGVYYDEQNVAVPITVRYESDGKALGLLDYPIITGPLAPVVPLRSLVSLHDVKERSLVTSENLIPTLDVSAFTNGEVLTRIIGKVEKVLAEIEVPEGYEVKLTGEKDNLSEARTEIGGAIGISLIAIYLLLVAQLRSFKHPITILLTVPLSVIGVGVALFVAGKPVSMPVMVGMVLLLGIVVNSSIILLEFIRQEIDKGVAIREALLNSVETRFRPIMMTSLSTITGMIPLAAEWSLGAERFSPLAVAVIGGMTSATFLTMIIIPVFYDIFEGKKKVVKPMIKKSAQVSKIALVLLLTVTLFSSGALNASEVVTLTPEKCGEMARKHSLTLKEKIAKRDVAESQKSKAFSGFFPKFNTSARVTFMSDVDPGVLTMDFIPGAPPQEVQMGEKIDYQITFKAEVSQPLFLGGAAINNYRATKEQTKLAHYGTELTEKSVIYYAQVGFYRVAWAREIQKSAEQSFKHISKHLARVEKLAENGFATNLDVQRVQARQAEVLMRKVDAESLIRKGEITLLSMVGLPLHTKFELEYEVEGLKADRPSDEAAITDIAIENRLEIKMAKTQEQFMEYRKKAS